MKNLFLYEKIFPEEGNKILENGVYYFENCTLVGIDIDVVPTITRKKYVSKMRCREFSLLQEWLIEFIKNAEEFEVYISSIKFNIQLDDVENAKSQLIQSKEFSKLAAFLQQSMDYYECEITDIDFFYKGNMFSIKTNGVLSIFDDDSVSDLSTANFMRVLQGDL